VVEASAEGRWVDVRQPGPTPAELIEGSRRPGEGDESGDRLAGAGDRHLLATLDDLTAVMP